MNQWNSFPDGRSNGFTHGQSGISVPEAERRALAHADIMGNRNLSVTFDIWDARPLPVGSTAQRKYVIMLSLRD